MHVVVPSPVCAPLDEKAGDHNLEALTVKGAGPSSHMGDRCKEISWFAGLLLFMESETQFRVRGIPKKEGRRYYQTAAAWSRRSGPGVSEWVHG